MGSVTGFRRSVTFAAVIAATLLVPAASAATPEFAVKAAYLSKFGIFVDWPKTAFDSPQSPVVLCVEGADPFGDTLDKIVQGQRIGNRAI
ncbi:MAG TPA: YfiR family protein, partial [Rhizomicrobium sp.]|nr:YfiR family protein [Rhizomicrobium sp.]